MKMRNSRSQEGVTQPSGKRRFTVTRWLMLLFAVGVGVGLINMMREDPRSRRIREQLVGTWTIPVTLTDGSVEQWIEEFRSDGTLRHYPLGQPRPGQSDDWKWHIAGTDLVIVYESHFTAGESALRTARQLGQLLRDRLKGNRYELEYSDRYAVRFGDGDTIDLTLLKDGVGDPDQMVTITRLSAQTQ